MPEDRGYYSFFHVLRRRVCHEALGADAVKGDLQQRVGAHRQDRQDHAAAKRPCAAPFPLPAAKLTFGAGFGCVWTE